MHLSHIATGRPESHRFSRQWPGHLPDTVAALLGVFERRLGRDEAISASGRYLVTACEFRAAVAHDELTALLCPDSRRALESARLAFAAMGAYDAAACIDVTLTDMDERSMPQPYVPQVADLRSGILELGADIDLRIARYARRHYGASAK